MSRYEIVPATHAHAAELAPRMRRADVEELADLGHAPLAALEQSIDASRHAYTASFDGRILCMFGVAPRSLLSDEAFPWLLAAPEMVRHAITLQKVSKPFITRARKEFIWLHNYVSPRNVVAIRWLRWLGFSIAATPTPVGPKGAMMLHFEMRDV